MRGTGASHESLNKPYLKGINAYGSETFLCTPQSLKRCRDPLAGQLGILNLFWIKVRPQRR